MTDTGILAVEHTPVVPALPAGACDCHTHVFSAGFAFDPARSYTPGQASVEDLLALQARLGLQRVVIVQPSPYGTDNACTLDAVRRLGDRARAVAVVDPGLGDAALRAMHAGGVRGVRINLETGGVSDPVQAGALLRQAADQVAGLGWHVQTYTNLRMIGALHQVMAALPCPLVIDHFGRAMAEGGVAQPGFDALLDLVRSGKAFVKLSAAHRIAADPDDAQPIATALIAANPTRMLWGSDWPHPGGSPATRDLGGSPATRDLGGSPASRDPAGIEPFTPTDDGAALNRLRRWTDAETFASILVANPARLYGFPPIG